MRYTYLYYDDNRNNNIIQSYGGGVYGTMTLTK